MREHLIKSYNKTPLNVLAEELGIENTDTVRKQASLLGVATGYHEWTDYEEEYLRAKWGEMTIQNIARKLKLTYQAVLQKSNRMGLGNQIYSSGDWYPIPLVSEILGVKTRTVYNWRDSGKLEVSKFAVGKTYRYRVRYSEFMRFIEENQSRYDTRKCDMVAIRGMYQSFRMTGDSFTVGKLPEWLTDKIASDNKKPKLQGPKSWTKKEERKLLRLKSEGVEVKNLHIHMNRTNDSVRGKLRELKMDS